MKRREGNEEKQQPEAVMCLKGMKLPEMESQEDAIQFHLSISTLTVEREQRKGAALRKSITHLFKSPL